jgi:hypothetical protein
MEESAVNLLAAVKRGIGAQNAHPLVKGHDGRVAVDQTSPLQYRLISRPLGRKAQRENSSNSHIDAAATHAQPRKW